jgi:hypothetical protein
LLRIIKQVYRFMAGKPNEAVVVSKAESAYTIILKLGQGTPDFFL